MGVSASCRLCAWGLTAQVRLSPSITPGKVGAGGTDINASVFVMWKKGRVQKRATKILSLHFLFEIEWHLIEVNHKCFFPGRKYRRIKVSPREKTWGNQGVKSAPSCQAKVPVSPEGLGLPAAISSRTCPHPPSHSQALSLHSCFSLEAWQTSTLILPRAALETQDYFPMFAAQNLLFLAELLLLCW